MIKEKKLEKNRRDGFTEEIRSGWLNKVHDILVKNDILHKGIST